MRLTKLWGWSWTFQVKSWNKACQAFSFLEQAWTQKKSTIFLANAKGILAKRKRKEKTRKFLKILMNVMSHIREKFTEKSCLRIRKSRVNGFWPSREDMYHFQEVFFSSFTVLRNLVFCLVPKANILQSQTKSLNNFYTKLSWFSFHCVFI